MGNIQTSLSSRENYIETSNTELPLRVREKETAMVLSDYPPPEVCEPLFRKGEWLRLISDEGYWWKVFSVQTREENYIPHCQAAKVYHGWLFEGVDRQKAEELLKLPGNRVGSFMIRVSTGGNYSLSLRHRVIMHYRIVRMPNNWYFISPRLTFRCLEDLVSHYSDIADGLCCVLTGPCLASFDTLQCFSSQSTLTARLRNFNRTTGDRATHVEQNASSQSAQRDSGLSYGVQDSVSSYLSLAGVQERRRNSWKRNKWRSVYLLPSTRLRSTASGEEDYNEVPQHHINH